MRVWYSMKVFTLKEAPSRGVRVVKEDGMSLCGIPLGQGVHKAIEKVAVGDAVRLHCLDEAVQRGGEGHIVAQRLVLEDRWKDPWALVSVETAPGVGGTMWLSAATFTEARIGNKVRRIYNPISTALGIRVLAAQAGEIPTALVAMAPGAAFLVQRDGDLKDQEGAAAPARLLVNWEGHWGDWGDWELQVRPGE